MSSGPGQLLWMVLVAGCVVTGCQARRPVSPLSSLGRSDHAQAEHATEADDRGTVTPAIQLEETADALAESEDKGPSRWTKLFGGFGKPKRIPLPRTDLDSESMFGESEASPSSPLDDF